jgi:hypothetical protein
VSRDVSTCPTPEEFAALALGDLETARAAALEAHAASCALCAAERELAREFVVAEVDRATEGDVAHIVAALETNLPVTSVRRATEGTVVAFPSTAASPATGRGNTVRTLNSTWRRWRTPLAAAAALTLAAGLFWQNRGTGGLEPLPPPQDGGPTRSAVELLNPVGDQRVTAATPPARLVFRWRPVDGAATYRVELSDVTGRVLWNSEVVSPEANVPAALRESLTTRVRYLWTVTALDDRSQPLASSEPAAFRFQPSEDRP